MKRAWAFSYILACSAIAILGGCNKDGSQNAAQEQGASAASETAGQAASGTLAASAAQPPGTLGTITKAQLPGEATETLRLIKAGGPFPFSEDGVMFRNSAAVLAQHPRGYYRTYTVRTPGSTDRGQRRIICGGPRKQINDCYYTDDYYVTFKRITE